MPRYKVIAPLLAVRHDHKPRHKAFREVSIGSIVVVTTRPDKVGIVEAVIDGEGVFVFQAELNEHARLLDDGAPGWQIVAAHRNKEAPPLREPDGV